jgi:hypothetical protein
LRHTAGTVAVNFKLIDATASDGTPRSDETRQKLARERTIATCLIRNADPSRYGTLITELANQYAGQKDNCPKDIILAESLLVMYKTPVNATGQRNGNQQRQQQRTTTVTTNGDPLHGLTLAQRTAIAIAGTDNQLRPKRHVLRMRVSPDTWLASALLPTQRPLPPSLYFSALSPSRRQLTPTSRSREDAYVLRTSYARGPPRVDPDWILL